MNQSITKKITTITAFLMLIFSVNTFGQIQPDVPTDAPPIFEKTISDVVNGPYEKTIEFTQNEDEFTVFEIAGYGVNTYEILNGNINLKDTQPHNISYYYPSYTYLIPLNKCTTCTITFGAIETDTQNKIIEATLKKYKKSRNQLRFNADNLHQTASSLKNLSEKIELSKKELLIRDKLGEKLKTIGLNRYIASQTAITEKTPIEKIEIELSNKLPKSNPDYLYNDSTDRLILAHISSDRGDNQGAINYIKNIQFEVENKENSLKEKLLYDQILSSTFLALSQAYLNIEADSDNTEILLEKSFRYAQETNSYVSQAIAYNNLGFLKRRRHKLDEALDFHKKALELSQTSEFIRSSSESSSQLSVMQTEYYLAVITAIKGRYYDSIKLINKAEAIANEYDISHWLAHIKAAKGRIYLELKQYDRSIPEYNHAWQLYSEIGDKEQLGILSINLSRLYSEIGNHELAIEYVNKGSELFSGVKDNEYQIKIKETLANALLANKNYTQANKLFDELLRIKDQSNDSFFEGRALTNKAEALIGSKKYEEAINTLTQASKIQKEKKDDLYYAKSNYFLALSHNLTHPKKTDSVLPYIAKAEGIIEGIRSNLHDDSLRQQYFALQKAIYELEISLYMKESTSTKSLENAIISAERFRSRTLIESINPDLNKNKGSTNQSTENNPDHLFRLMEDLKNRTSEDQQFSPEMNYLKSLDNDTALLYFFSGAEESYSWLITRHGIYSSTLPESTTLALEVNNYIRTINKAPNGGLNKKIWSNLFYETRKLSSLLIGPYLEKLGSYNRIVIFPDGPLHRVPFSALDTKLDDNKLTYLMESHDISYSPSLLIHERLLDTQNSNHKDSLLLVANPKISSEKNSHNEFNSELPSTKNEANAINKLWKKFGTVEFLEQSQANKKNLQNKIKSNYEILHFATHALADWDNPDQSSIALSNSNIQIDENPNITLKEIKSWDISPDLVVLSACDTAIGLQIEGEGPIGLSRAFIEAGATRVIASLWPIDDSASAELMQQFYVNLFTKNLTPSSALSSAQKEIKKNTKWNHPYYWSGFNLFGNPNQWRSKHSAN